MFITTVLFLKNLSHWLFWKKWGGSGGIPPQKILRFRCLEMLFSLFPRQYLGLKTIKIKTILTIFYVYYNRSFPQNFNLWLLEKSEIINVQMLIQKKYIQCFKFKFSFWKKRAQQCLPRFIGCGRHFGTCKSLGSSPVKMSQAFNDPSICFNFLYFHRKVNTFKTPEMCLYLDSDVWAWCFTIIFAGSFNYFKPVSCWILFSKNVTGIPEPFDQLPSRMR